MSLTSFIQLPEVVARIKPFRPPPPRKINAPLKVPPRTKNWSLVGTAFDYLLRFEMKRRAPHAQDKPWVAEAAHLRISNLHIFPHLQEQVAACGWKDYEVVAFCEGILSEAKAAYLSFVKMASPTSSQLATVAA